MNQYTILTLAGYLDHFLDHFTLSDILVGFPWRINLVTPFAWGESQFSPGPAETGKFLHLGIRSGRDFSSVVMLACEGHQYPLLYLLRSFQDRYSHLGGDYNYVNPFIRASCAGDLPMTDLLIRFRGDIPINDKLVGAFKPIYQANGHDHIVEHLETYLTLKKSFQFTK